MKSGEDAIVQGHAWVGERRLHDGVVLLKEVKGDEVAWISENCVWTVDQVGPSDIDDMNPLGVNESWQESESSGEG